MRHFSSILRRELSGIRSLVKPAQLSTMGENDIKLPDPGRECEEIRIQFSWGQIAGKWWGPLNVRPIVGIHGWQDNAGTFDTLAPLLPKHVGLLALDLPGHGLSSRIPDGMFYNTIDALLLLNLIQKEYNWDKVSIIGHSMSSIIGFIYSALYPDRVDMMVGLDALKPHVRDPNKIIPRLRERLDNFLIADQRNQSKTEPPSYNYEELTEKMISATMGSLTKTSCDHLFARAVTKSTKYPEKYFFHRDSRLKYYNYAQHSQELCVDMAKQIKHPYLFVKSSDSPYYEDKKYFTEVLEVMQATNSKFEFHKVKGTHHVHLNEPEVVSGIISEFINKYRPVDSSANSKL